MITSPMDSVSWAHLSSREQHIMTIFYKTLTLLCPLSFDSVNIAYWLVTGKVYQ